MGAKSWVRCVATAAAVTTVMAAAACASKGGAAGTNGDLNSESAAQAVLEGQSAGGAQHTVHNHATITEKAFTITMDGVQRTDALEEDQTSATTTAATNTTVHGEIRVEGNAVYLNDPGLPATYRQGKTWVKIDLTHPLSAAPGAPASALYATLSSTYRHWDPRQASAFTLAFSDLHRVGVETRDGERALHIAGTLTLATLPATPPAGSGLTQDYLDYRRQQLQAVKATKVGIDCWYGADGRLIESIEVDSTADGDTVIDLTAVKWGVPLTVSVPPAADSYVVPVT